MLMVRQSVLASLSRKMKPSLLGSQCRWSSKRGNEDATTNLTAGERYQLYFEQMQELQNEQKSLFGDDNSTGPIEYDTEEGEPAIWSPSAREKMYRQEMEQLKDEREEMFGFTDDDIKSWKNHGNNQKHDPAFLETIEQARRIQQQKQKRKENRINALAEKQVEPPPPPPPKQQQEEEAKEAPATPVLSHVDEQNRIHMVDVGHKTVTQRIAVARSIVRFPESVMRVLTKSDHELVGPKGPILQTATVAGIMAAKQTSNLIPLCHPLPIQQVAIDFRWITNNALQIDCTCRVESKTGVEMEALSGATIAALTVYDMVKAVSHDVTIAETKLVQKQGGKRSVDKREE
jgi:cyclic pyranopterin phosphate synthase